MNTGYTVLLFYTFKDVADPQALMERERAICTELGLTGRVLIGEEGVNGTLEGTNEATEQYKEHLKNDPYFSDMPVKESEGTGKSFPKLKIKIRKEIVTLGAGRFDVRNETATELPAEDLEKWYQNNEDFVVLDLRNSYEIDSGKFERTIDPGLRNFRDLPEKLKELGSLKDKKVVTVCTGGIRCEKATCLLKREGFTDVYQLKDGIHTYMQKFPGSRFKGTLFVFDDRMTTDVVPIEKKEVIGNCVFCNIPTETYCSDDSTKPSTKVLCCDTCFATSNGNLRRGSFSPLDLSAVA